VKCVLRGKLRQCEIDSIVSEITILKKLKHQNIVQMEDFAWDSNYIYIIMGNLKKLSCWSYLLISVSLILEYCGQGDLSRYIRAHKVLPESICRKFLQQLSSALKVVSVKFSICVLILFEAFSISVPTIREHFSHGLEATKYIVEWKSVKVGRFWICTTSKSR